MKRGDPIKFLALGPISGCGGHGYYCYLDVVVLIIITIIHSAYNFIFITKYFRSSQSDIIDNRHQLNISNLEEKKITFEGFKY